MVRRICSKNYEELRVDPNYKEVMKSKFFHLHNPIYGKDFQKKISIYDWGIYMFRRNLKKMNVPPCDMAFGNKISSYLEAGLPIIVNSELKFVSEVVKNNEFGIVINNVNELDEVLEKINYDKMLLKIKEKRTKFAFSSNSDNLIDFLFKPNI